MVYHHNKATEEILNGVMNLPSIPKFGMILFPSNLSSQFVWEMFFDDEAECANILEELLSHRYLSLHTAPTTHDDYNLTKLFDVRNDNFKQAV
jgi:hypothetical protein